MNRSIFTKNMDIQRALDQLMKSPVTRVNPMVAQEMGRNKTIRYLRSRDSFFIGFDSKKHISLINIKSNVKIRKVDNKYFFDFF